MVDLDKAREELKRSTDCLLVSFGIVIGVALSWVMYGALTSSSFYSNDCQCTDCRCYEDGWSDCCENTKGIIECGTDARIDTILKRLNELEKHHNSGQELGAEAPE